MSNIIGPDGLSGCFRCAFVWTPRTTEPARCPRCRSRLWDTPILRPVRRGSGLGLAEVILPRKERLEQALRQNKARNPRIFGSIARNDADGTSDVDLLVDFESGASVFDPIGLMQDLERIFRRKADVVEPPGLHWLVRPQILFEARPV